MNSAIEDLCFDSASDWVDGVVVFGEPIHTTSEEMIERFLHSSIESFLATLARTAVGNFALVHKQGDTFRVITSPGYCGGYFVREANGSFACSTLLTPVLRRMQEIEMASYPLCFFLSHAPKSSFQSLPLSTVFKNVTRLPPATVLIAGSVETSMQSYLGRLGTLSAAESFEQALDEVTGAIAAYYKRIDISPALMFSGGVDSLVIYLSLSRQMDPSKIRVFTMDHSPSNGPERAYPVAEKLGIKTQFVSTDSLMSEKSLNVVLDMMRKDIVATKAPHLAFIEMPVGCPGIIHGQNMDAMAGNNMLVLHVNLEKGYLSDAKGAVEPGSEAELRQLRAFIGNLQFTNAYLEDPQFQKNTAKFFSKLSKAGPDRDAGGKGILRGMFNTQLPNVIGKYVGPASQVTGLTTEVELFEKFAPMVIGHPLLAADFARYYSYSHLANKRGSSLPMPDGSRPLFAPMSGPISSYFLGKARGLSAASSPKAEIYQLAEKYTGTTYSDLIVGPTKKKSVKQEFPVDLMLEVCAPLLDKGRSKLINAIKDERVRAHVSAIYDETLSGLQPDQPKFSAHNQSRGRQILNLELILDEATKPHHPTPPLKKSRKNNK